MTGRGWSWVHSFGASVALKVLRPRGEFARGLSRPKRPANLLVSIRVRSSHARVPQGSANAALGHECRGPYRRAGVGAIERKMPIRLRKFIGAILLILLVVTWALLAMAFAQSPLVKTNGVIEVIYYVVAGLGWVLPAMPLIRWMSRPDVG